LWLSYDRLWKEMGLGVERLHETEQIVQLSNIRDIYSGSTVFLSLLERVLTRLGEFVCSAALPDK
jgi:hypothetical protein